MSNYTVSNIKGLMKSMVAIMEEGKFASSSIKIWDRRIVTNEENIHTQNCKYSVGISDDERLKSCIVKLLVNEEPFEVRVYKGDRVHFVKWSFEVSFGEIKNFIENIIKANIYEHQAVSHTDFRGLIRETFPEKFESTDIVNSIIDYIVKNLDDESINDRDFRYNLKERCS